MSEQQTSTREAAPPVTVSPNGAADHPAPAKGGGWAQRLLGARDALARATLDNPVLVKEFRTRMRGTRAYWILLAYTLLLAGVLAIMYFTYEANAIQQAEYAAGTVTTQGARDLGRAIYWFVFIAQAIMVALITPAITSGAVTIEREQRSYELLVTTPLRPVDIIRGKLTAAVSFVVLLLTASLPLVSLSFLVGGVSPAEIFFSYLIVALASFLYGSLGIFWSSTLRTTAVATVVTYLTVLSLFVVTLMPGLTAHFSSFGGGTGAMPEVPFQSFNPLTASLRAVHPEYLFAAQIPSWISAAVLNLLVGMLIANSAMGRLEHFEPPWPFWTRLLSTLLWCAGTLFFFAPIFGGVSRTWTAQPAVQESIGQLMMVMLVLLCLVTPVLNTGDLIVRRGESAIGRYLSGFSPHRMFANDLSCGFPLVLLWAAFVLALVPVAVLAAGKGGMFSPFDVLIPGAILILSVIAGLAGIGNLLSVALPSRWAACVLTYLVAVVAMLLPYFTLFPWYQMTNKPAVPQLLWQLLYFVPFEGLRQLMTPGSFWTDHPAMLFGTAVPFWLVTSALYLGIAAACFLATAVRIRRVGSSIQQRMEAGEAVFQNAAA